MPGLIVFRRRWSVGSDDLVVPGAFLLTIHLLWLILLFISLFVFDYNDSYVGVKLLWFYQIGYIFILCVSAAIELLICIISMKGSILETKPRASMHICIYFKSVVIFFDVAWLVLGVLWIKKFYFDATVGAAKEIILGLVICNWLVVLTMLITIWCTFDAAGRSWVKMKKYQRSMRESESRFNYKRSGSMNRNWRQRKVIRAYQDSWDHRCRLLFCCMRGSERNKNSFADIARLLSDFFRELDVVPSDVVAGLVLLRKFQKLEREAIVRQRKNGILEFLSGVPITERTQFLPLNDIKEHDRFQTVVRYMYFAQGAYGWPMYLMAHRSGVCHLCPEMRCCHTCCVQKGSVEIIRDNCCRCNYAALKKMLQIGDVEVIYATYHVDIGETPFFVALDYSQHKIVISIRGTLSMKDILTDLNAEGDVLPLDPPREDWLGHKGMVQAAIYIKKKLEEENLIQKAMTFNSVASKNFGLVLVGHSLGAGTASILAIMLKPQYPTLECYSYSPPGGLLSMPAVEYSKSFITSVVVGKDVVPRIGLHQMEALRADLINAIKRSIDPKWKTITCSVICCGCGAEPSSVVQMSSHDTNINQYEEQKNTARTTSVHPTDSSIALTLHQPLYPPGRIIHIVRTHPYSEKHKNERTWRHAIKQREPVFRAIWAETTDFDEVLISPVMLQDHMPDNVLTALKKVLTTVGPLNFRRQRTYGASFYHSLETTKSSFTKNATLKLSHLEHNRPITPKYGNKERMLNDVYHIDKEIPFTLYKRSALDKTVCVRGLPDEPNEAQSINRSTFTEKSHIDHVFNFKKLNSDNNCAYEKQSCGKEAVSVSSNDVFIPCYSTNRENVEFDASYYVKVQDRYVSSEKSSLATKKKKQIAIGSLFVLHQKSAENKLLEPSHNDFSEIAPLASPESFSEISSISSGNSSCNDNSNQKLLKGAVESQFYTPRIMRRAPKIMENLSACAEDWISLQQYSRTGQAFQTSQIVALDDAKSTGSSGQEVPTHCRCFEKGQSALKNVSKSEFDQMDTMASINLLNNIAAIEPYNGSNCSACAYETQIEEFSNAALLGSHVVPVNSNTSPNETFFRGVSTFKLSNSIKCLHKTGLLESHFPVYRIDIQPATQASIFPGDLIPNDNIPSVVTGGWESSSVNRAHSNRSLSETILNENIYDMEPYSCHEYLPLATKITGYASPDFLFPKKKAKTSASQSRKINESSI